MASEKLCALHAHIARKHVVSKAQPEGARQDDPEQWRRYCGCIRTSDKLKEIIKTIPSAPPPSPSPALFDQKCFANFYSESTNQPNFRVSKISEPEVTKLKETGYLGSKTKSIAWQFLADLVHLLQLSVTATALALYYVIYCYMQLIYYTLRSALYFHNADGPMKITIGVVTITSVIIGFNLIIRMEKMIGIYLF